MSTNTMMGRNVTATRDDSGNVTGLRAGYSQIATINDGRMRLSPRDTVINMAGLDRWYQALANAEHTPAYLLATGNSTIDGVSTDGTTTPADTQMDALGYLGQLRSKFARHYGAPEAGSIPAIDSRWVYTGTACSASATTNTTGPGGVLFKLLNNGSIATITTPVCTDISIDFFQGSSAFGEYTYEIDGGGAVAVADVTGVLEYKSIDITGLAATTHTVVVTGTSVNKVFFGGLRYHSGRGVLISKYAKSGQCLHDSIGDGPANDNNTVAGIVRAKKGARMGNPDLFVVSYARNDWVGANSVPAITVDALRTIYEDMYGYVTEAGGCMMILDEPADRYHPLGSTGLYPVSLQDIYDMHAEFARTHTHCANASFTRMFGTWAEGQARAAAGGLYRNASDEIHFGLMGQGAAADALWEILKPGMVY